MKKGCGFLSAVLVIVLGVGAVAAAANTGAAVECEHQLTPATMADLRALYYKSVSPSLTEEQRLTARSLYREKLRIAAIIYSTTMEKLHEWVISANRQSIKNADNSNQTTEPESSITLRVVFHPRLKHKLHGHTDHVFTPAFSPDGTKIITTSRKQNDPDYSLRLPDFSAQIWDVETGMKIHSLTGHSGEINTATFSTDSKKVITASADGTAIIWDAVTGKEIHSLQALNSDVTSAAFSPDGASVVTTHRHATAIIWNTTTGKETLTLRGHTAIVMSATFLPDSKRVATAAYDHTLRIWDAVKHWYDFKRTYMQVFRERIRKQTHVLTHIGPANSNILSTDGTKVLTLSAGIAQIWNTKTGKEIRKIVDDQYGFLTAEFSPDSTKIVTTSQKPWTAQIWDATTGKELLTLTAQTDSIKKISFSPDGSKVIATTNYNTRIWDATTGKELHKFISPHGDLVDDAAFSPDSKKIIITYEDNTAWIWDLYVTEEELLDRPEALDSAENAP